MLAVEILLKVVFGTIVYAVFRRWAKSGQPSRAAMMLTFPVLNGIGLAMTGGDDSTEAKVGAMLPMIGVNGLICIGFICAVEAIAARTSTVATKSAWSLALLGLLFWFSVFKFNFTVPNTLHWPFIGVCAAIGTYASVLWWSKHPYEPQPIKTPTWWELLCDRWVWGFAAVLTGLLLFAMKFADWHEDIGKLSALPLLPLWGLVAIAVEGKLTILQQMKPAVLLGPLIAMMFSTTLPLIITGLGGLFKSLVLLLGWLLCAFVITRVSTFFKK